MNPSKQQQIDELRTDHLSKIRLLEKSKQVTFARLQKLETMLDRQDEKPPYHDDMTKDQYDACIIALYDVLETVGITKIDTKQDANIFLCAARVIKELAEEKGCIK